MSALRADRDVKNGLAYKIMKIAIDIDDTLADFSPVFIKYLNKKYNKSFKLDNFDHSIWWDVLKIEKKEIISILYDFYDDEKFKTIIPIKGAVDAVNKLSLKHELICITARAKTTEKDTFSWIKKYFGELISEIFITDLHMFNDGKISKGSICIEQGVDLLIDDLPKFNVECSQNGIKTFLFDRPWNQEVKGVKNLKRVYSWKEIVEILN